MKRTFLAALIALAALGCTGQPTAPATPTTPCPAPPSPGTPPAAQADDTTPEAAVCGLVADLRRGDCEPILDSLSRPTVDKLVQRAGTREQLCQGFRNAAEEIVSKIESPAVGKENENGPNATVVLKVRDNKGHEDTSRVPLVKEGEAWKVSEIKGV